MPLFEKVRIEAYIPDSTLPEYQDILDILELEFTYAFGGCTIMAGLNSNYQSQAGFRMKDKVNFIYTDAPFNLENRASTLEKYAEVLYAAAFEAL